MIKLDSIKSLAKSFSDIVRNNSSTILTAMGVIGTVTSVVMAVKATPLAIDALEEDKNSRSEKLINPDEITTGISDYIRVCWKIYTPTALMTALSVACIISAQTINLKRNAALMALYTASSTSLKEYKDKTLELVGKNKEQSIRDAIDNDHIEANPASSNEIIDTGFGKMLCYDSWSGRYFSHSIEGIRKAMNDLNKAILANEYVTLNEFYYTLGLSDIKLGEYMGWDTTHMIDMVFSSQLTNDGKPCLVMNFRNEPIYEFAR